MNKRFYIKYIYLVSLYIIKEYDNIFKVAVEELEVEKIADGQMEENEFYETRELDLGVDQIDLKIIYG